MRTHAKLTAGVMALLAMACAENPPLAPDDHEETLTVDLTMEPGHVHTLSPVTFRATVRDGHGEIVTNLDTLRVERLSAGSTTWRTAAELTLVGSAYEGEATFVSSGEYELRVMGMRSGHSAMEHMTTSTPLEPLHVARAHEELEGLRVEFETFPGHVHEGDTVMVKFWVLEPETNAAGVRPPISGLAPDIHCLEGGALTETHAAMEHEPGVYGATHVFHAAGEAGAEIVVSTASGVAQVEFPFHVAHKH